ncbi:MAG: peptidylprolyl isomerase [Clostridia bacterium]|nr:peptidylprolyl isomerase [Clostridia bacterium]
MIEIKMKNGGIIKLELYPDKAPKTVANFEKLVSEKFYDGLTFHRVISGFMIQGGDPLGNGMGGSEENIPGEFAANGFDNPIRHERGVISMARSNNPNSASSQFFIMHADGFFLDGNYAAFGKVVEGMDVVDAIAEVETVNNMFIQDLPKEPVVIETIRIVE